MPRFGSAFLPAGLALAAIAQPALAADAPSLDLSGDVRLRLEQDWDSQKADGSKRDERTRARIRVRINAKADLGDGFALKGRVRTGGKGSQQNANITFKDFDHNPGNTLKITPDRYSLAWKGKSGGVEAGRMGFPFFTPNEYLWDGDVSPLGLAGNVSMPISGSAKLKFNAGGFMLPAGLSHYSGALYAGQAVLESGGATLAAGLFRFDADAGDPDRLILLDSNGSRDYTVLALNAQYALPAGDKPLVLGADFFRNLKSYNDPTDAIGFANRKERTGYVLSAAWGDTKAPGHLQLGYRWFRMERLAVNASYAHDDVARFGTASQASLTDLKGHDVYANYAVCDALSLGLRAMFVERLTSIEDGKRARIDLVYKF
ncbi:MAG: porin [Novosphingobium sp.]|nr:putative porin [Novosphingobium sp.]